MKVDKRNKWSVGTTQSLVLTKETLVNKSRFNHQRGRNQDQRVGTYCMTMMKGHASAPILHDPEDSAC